jgi:NAD(P)H-hydrate epimerase
MPGAAALVCGASVHAGSGLTVLCAPEDVCRVVLSHVPEMTTIPIPESSEGAIGTKALDLIRPRLGEFHAVAIGPGLSTHPATMEFARTFVGEVSVPVVVDADAITALAGDSVELGRAILTPHAGELARLVGRSGSDLERDRLEAATEAARNTKAVVLFKGPGTVITNGTHTLVNGTGGAPLAQGGTGDVLTGLVGSLIAQSSTTRTLSSIETVEIVATAAWIHGAAAERIAARVWPHPANASALIEEIGPTMHEILHG